MQLNEYCPDCGEKVARSAAYCNRCGASLEKYGRTTAPGSMVRRWQRRHASSPVWGILSFFGFFIIIGLTFTAYPNVIDRIARYFSELASLGRLVLPGYYLGQPIIYFLNLSGAWQVVQGSIRLALSRDSRPAIGNIVSGAYSLYLAHLFNEFYLRTIPGHILVFYGIVGLAGLIIVNAVIWAIAWQHE